MKLHNIGDIVYFNDHEAKILSIKFDQGEPFYELEFVKKGLVPPFMLVNQRYVSVLRGKDPNGCPLCGCGWTITKFNSKIWRDCANCNKTEETLIEEAKAWDEFNKETDKDLPLQFDFDFNRDGKL